MPSTEARIETARPSRYLVQLCQHAEAIAGMAHGAGTHPGGGAAHDGGRVRVEWSRARGVIDFAGRGRCTVEAGTGTLTLRVDADDEGSLRKIRDIVAADLDRFGRRERLRVVWT